MRVPEPDSLALWKHDYSGYFLLICTLEQYLSTIESGQTLTPNMLENVASTTVFLATLLEREPRLVGEFFSFCKIEKIIGHVTVVERVVVMMLYRFHRA
jgi:hypothetical protein